MLKVRSLHSSKYGFELPYQCLYIKCSVHIYIKTEKMMMRIFSGETIGQTKVSIDLRCNFYSVWYIILSISLLIAIWLSLICLKLTLGHWQGESLTYPIQNWLAIPLCHSPHFLLPQILTWNGDGKEKMVTKNLVESPNQLHTYLWLICRNPRVLL